MKIKLFSPYSKVRKSSIYKNAKNICSILKKNGFQAYFVGGCVRDLILNPNHVPKDIDLASSALPNELSALFKQLQFVGQNFCVCLVRQGQHQFEIATFRKEGAYSDRRHPDTIHAGSFLEDSLRRDFRINALYYDPIQKLVLDPQNGLNDLKQKRLCCVGEPEKRLYEDSLRILRLLRFASNLSFLIETKTLNAAQKYQNGLKLIPKERIILEFEKCKNTKKFIQLLIQHDLYRIIFPSLNAFIKKDKIIGFPKSPFSETRRSPRTIQLKYPFIVSNILLNSLGFMKDTKILETKLDFINLCCQRDDKKLIHYIFNLIKLMQSDIDKKILDVIIYRTINKILINQETKNIILNTLSKIKNYDTKNILFFMKNKIESTKNISQKISQFILEKSNEQNLISIYINLFEINHFCFSDLDKNNRSSSIHEPALVLSKIIYETEKMLLKNKEHDTINPQNV